MGRFAKRFSGERPVSLGFELSFYPSLVSLFGGCLTATRSVALVYVKHPPKCHLKFFPMYDRIVLLKNRRIVYANNNDFVHVND